MRASPENLKRAVSLIDELIALAGLDKSESATEDFAVILGVASCKARDEVRQSHKEGLSLDTRYGIAETILAGWPGVRAYNEHLNKTKGPM